MTRSSLALGCRPAPRPPCSVVTGTISAGAGGLQTASAALVSIFTDVANSAAQCTYTLTTSVISAEGAVVATTTSSGNLSASTGFERVSQSIKLQDPVYLWNLEVPYLYTVHSGAWAGEGWRFVPPWWGCVCGCIRAKQRSQLVRPPTLAPTESP